MSATKRRDPGSDQSSHRRGGDSMATVTMKGEEFMTDKQWDGMLLMIATIVEKCKDKDEILEAIHNLMRGKESAKD
jgi:hypothetical protein